LDRIPGFGINYAYQTVKELHNECDDLNTNLTRVFGHIRQLFSDGITQDYVQSFCSAIDCYNKQLVFDPIMGKQCDLKGNIIKEWISGKQAAKKLKIPASNISLCCKGKGKTTGGFKWKYKENG
jgi:hypothetical protein